MLFNSIEYAFFLPIVFLLYWFIFNKSLKGQNLFIVLVSYLFYGWWDWRFLFLIAFTSFCSWGSGLLIEKYRHQTFSNKHYSTAQWISASNIILNLLILGVFKYADFFMQSFADAFLSGHSEGLLLKIILPVGISFYTFQALSYSIDVYKQKIKPTKDIVQFFAYVSFFPQLVAGPIERATNLLPQFAKPRVFDYHQAVDGCRQMLWGFFKKIVIADNCAIYVNEVFDSYQTQTGSTLLLAAILFAFQIYGDFSGYSDIAIGTAKLFGFTLMQNFNVPYFSRDIAEFWRRWHISLTTWFRDYLYIPLGGSRVSQPKVIRNIFIIFLVSGLWHGANWTFIAWGAYHATLFLPLILLKKNRKYTNTVAEGRLLPSFKEFAQMTITFLLVVFGWIIFRSNSISMAYHYIIHIFNLSLFSKPYLMTKVYYIPLFSFITILIVTEWLQRQKQHALEIKHKKVFQAISYIFIILFLFMYGNTAKSFIYFQF